jgi:hypothetical protein
MLCLKLLPMNFNIKENREHACILGASIRTAQAKASQINK